MFSCLSRRSIQLAAIHAVTLSLCMEAGAIDYRVVSNSINCSRRSRVSNRFVTEQPHNCSSNNSQADSALAPSTPPPAAKQQPVAGAALIDGQGLGWREMNGSDFVMVNGDQDTWTWDGSKVYCKGTPVGVTRSTKQFENFELVATWRHLKSGGNSGIFIWTSETALTELKPGQLPPGGIEVQVLDHGYAEQYEAKTGKKPDWFTTHGDVFPVGKANMTPFPPVAPGGKRSFPRKNLSRGVGEWNHYYVRAINGEVRLWVNGEEVSGGTNCEPRKGFICLESEGAPVEFNNIRIRELP